MPAQGLCRSRAALCAGIACLTLAGCQTNTVATRVTDERDVAALPDTVETPTPRPKRKAAAKPAAPKGDGYSAVGLASWYGGDFHGKRTALGEAFDMNALTAAHPSLPIPSTVRVTNLSNHRSLLLRVNDRGPFVGQRVIDVSAKSAQLLGFYDRGVARVKVDYIGRAARTVAANAPAQPAPAPAALRQQAAAAPQP